MNQPVTRREPAGPVNNPEPFSLPAVKAGPLSVTGCYFQDKSVHLILTDPVQTTQQERRVMRRKRFWLRISFATETG